MKIHQDWDTPAFEYSPAAPSTGPFPRRDVLRTWWQHRAAAGDELLLVEGAECLVPLYRGERGIGFLGEEDLTDYHSPLGTGIGETLAAFLVTVEPGTPFRFDSLPAEAAEPIEKAIGIAGLTAEVTEHEVAAVLALPADYESYLAGLGKKERHEVRRKRRRFELLLGFPRLVRSDEPTALASFVDMHRMAPGEKGEFMTDKMAAYFSALLGAGAIVHLLLGESDRPVAAGIGFSDRDAYYLYNSSFDPAASEASPGIVLLAMLIEHAIADGKPVFDFLKGDEEYKFRHGASRRPLYAIAGTVGQVGRP